MPHGNELEAENLAGLYSTKLQKEFARLIKMYPKRPVVVSEGDSYPVNPA
jgi:hypothetical protein